MATTTNTPVADLEGEVRDLAIDAVETVVNARSHINTLNKAKGIAQDDLLVIVKENGENPIDVDGHTVSVVHAHTRDGLEKDKLRQFLVEEGVSPLVVSRAFAHAAKVTHVAEHVLVS